MENLLKKRGFFWILMLVVLGAVLLLPLSVFAESDVPEPTLTLKATTGYESVKSLINDYSNNLADFDFLKGGSSDKDVVLNKSDYLQLSNEQRQKLMGYALKTIADSGMQKSELTRLYNFVESQDEAMASLVRELSTDVSADYVTASAWLSTPKKIVSVLLGIVAILTIIGLVANVTIDVAFLALPMFQAMLIDDRNVKPKLVSNEAWNALKTSEQNGGIGYMGTYFKHRIWMMFVLSISIGYLLHGQLFQLIGWILDVSSNMFSL